MELLIVIGIIAVLSAVLLGTFGGATESARAAKCMSNMRTLAELSAAAAVKDEVCHAYLPAGSYQALEVDSGSAEIFYQKHDGWISWLCRNNEFKNGVKYGGPATGIKTMPFFGNGNREDEIFALTNGTLARASRMLNRDLYVCPSHAHYREQNNLSKPIYSYAMNAIFGFDTSKGSGVSGWGFQSFGNISNPQYVYGNAETKSRISPKLAPERTLMFAEIPFEKWSDGSWSRVADAEGVESDMVLNFKATVGGCERGKFWDGNPEAIGFNHRASKNKRCAHVVFADGHVEKFVHAPNGELDDYQLTAQLCEGGEVSHKGSGYYAIETGK